MNRHCAPWKYAAVAGLLLCAVLLGTLSGCPSKSGGGISILPVSHPKDVVGLLKDATVYVETTLTLPDGEISQSGSGFVVDDGLIITNAHVVSLTTETDDGRTLQAEKREVSVTFHPGTDQEEVVAAEVMRENHEVDLAVLKVDTSTPVKLALADSDAVQETSKVFVAGHPLGLKEVSITTGTVTSAKRTFNGQRYIEHDAEIEHGNSGGPMVDEQGKLLGVQVAALATDFAGVKFAIPANILRDWLAADPQDDPAPPKPGDAVLALLEKAELKFKEAKAGIFALPYENDITVYVHQAEDFLRVFVPLGELPSQGSGGQGQVALEALRFNYTDPVGRLSVEEKEGTRDLYWESQIPGDVATPEYLKLLCQAAANQAERWGQIMADEAPNDPEALYPGGDDKEQLGRLEELIKQAEMQYEPKDTFFKMPYDNDVTVYAKMYKGMAYIHSWTGGMPGADDAEQGNHAIEMLKRNWEDPFGRLSLDKEDDVAWESQVPLDFLTPDYLKLLGETCATQTADFLKQFGSTPLNGGD